RTMGRPPAGRGRLKQPPAGREEQKKVQSGGGAYGWGEARQTPQRVARVSTSSAVGSTTKLLGFITEVRCSGGTWARPNTWPISWAIVMARTEPERSVLM